MFKQYMMQKAFTLLEVIMVIVILGIVASIGSSALVNVYETYITQRAIHDASLKTELAINQLANRLTYRMNGTLIARRPGKTGTVEGVDFFAANNVPLNLRETFTALEWIGYDRDGFEARKAPAWSGFCNVTHPRTNFNRIASPGTQPVQLGTIIDHYTGTTDRTGGALHFVAANYEANNAYSEACHYAGRTAGCMFPVTMTNWRTITFNGDGNRTAGQMVYSQFYQYSSSAFAVVPEQKSAPDNQINGQNVYDLHFYYAYQPWQNENYLNGRESTLLENVSVFRFRDEPNAIRLKICVVERISDTDQISICKEKAVIR